MVYINNIYNDLNPLDFSPKNHQSFLVVFWHLILKTSYTLSRQSYNLL